jgi:hypothetical protein
VEAAAASLGFEHGEFVRALFLEMTKEQYQARDWRKFSYMAKLMLVVDAKVAYDTIANETLPEDRRVALDLMALKESLGDSEANAFCRWVPGPQHCADGLTKTAGNGMLEAVMLGSEWSLVEDPEFAVVRQKQRANQRVYRERLKAARKGSSAVPGGVESNGELQQNSTEPKYVAAVVL